MIFPGLSAASASVNPAVRLACCLFPNISCLSYVLSTYEYLLLFLKVIQLLINFDYHNLKNMSSKHNLKLLLYYYNYKGLLEYHIFIKISSQISDKSNSELFGRLFLH